MGLIKCRRCNNTFENYHNHKFFCSEYCQESFNRPKRVSKKTNPLSGNRCCRCNRKAVSLLDKKYLCKSHYNQFKGGVKW